MSKDITKEHSRRAMELLEDLTGGLIKKEDILSNYRAHRRINYTRTDAIWEAFRSSVFGRYYHYPQNLLPEYNEEKVKVSRSRYEEVYERVTISYPDAIPAEFVLKIYETSPEERDSYYTYVVFKKQIYIDYEGSFDVVYASRENKQIYDKLSDAVEDGLETLVKNMVVYAIDKTVNDKPVLTTVNKGFWKDIKDIK